MNYKESPLVSFIVIAYNQEKYIEEAIRGAFAQTYEPLEIILSDDNSPDKTFEIMQRLVEEYDGPHKVILNRNEPNLGIGGHINRVMELSQGEFIVINAGDDISLPERTTELVDVWINSGRQAKSIFSDCHRIDENGHVYENFKFGSVDNLSTPELIVQHNAYVIGACHGWDRSIFDFFGPISPDVVHEDRVLPLRSALIGKVEYVSKPLMKYRDGGISSNYETKGVDEILYGQIVDIHKRYYVDNIQKIKDIKFFVEKNNSNDLYDNLIDELKSQMAIHHLIIKLSECESGKLLLFFNALKNNASFKKSFLTYLKYQFPNIYSTFLSVKYKS